MLVDLNIFGVMNLTINFATDKVLRRTSANFLFYKVTVSRFSDIITWPGLLLHANDLFYIHSLVMILHLNNAIYS